jgi:D-methionine transport system substrate-binding protein
MITRKQFVTSAFGVLLAGSLVACGGNASDSGAPDTTATDTASKTLVVAASPSPHAEILTKFAAPLLEEQGIALEVKEYTDYIQPNVATSTGEVDANYFQHINYLNNYNKENGTDLVSAGAIHYEPFGVYSNDHKSLDEIEDGATIAIPNDPTNEGRALLVLQQEGLITLSDPEDLEATPKDIAENPKNIQFQELEAAALPRALDDVDYAVINGNYAIEAGLHVADAVAVEANDGKAVEQYGNIICTTPDKLDDERIVALVEVLQSDDFAQYLKDNYDQDVLPAV